MAPLPARRTRPSLLLVLCIVALVVASCGGGDDNDTAGATQVESAFLQAMVPHHESAVAMARLAVRRAGHPQVVELGNAIADAQQKEIVEMKRIHKRLFGESLLPNEDAHVQLGLAAKDAGMMHGSEAVAMLRNAKPFDRAFMDEMIPHHQGAIRMARAVLADGEDAEIERLATAVISTQTREIEEMNRWRQAWYGAASPAGGVPGDQSGDMGGSGEMEHEGH